ncbi:MerR family transcriptional regulator [Telmatospirillum sp.]|uniref:MerR family transcriptional regulator n=1 Tax=Telmatospirillum sp. TaxID=2079197 RepID=UPI002842BB26|nr:MerR family transcriptional regulator [Telmatospirillum sp.]MDR3439036.1 MerR family transcriptional regulator [Telmatospirillum sp.]
MNVPPQSKDFDELFAVATKMPKRHELASAEEAAAMLGCSIRTLRYLQAHGEMPRRYRHGRRQMYVRADVVKMAKGRA